MKQTVHKHMYQSWLFERLYMRAVSGKLRHGQMHQPAPGKQCKSFIMVHESKLKEVDKFTYLGSKLSQTVTINDVNCAVAKTSIAFDRVHSQVWESRSIHFEKPRFKSYKAVDITILIYGCETRTVNVRHVKQLNHFHMTCLCPLMNIIWQHKVPDTEFLTRATLPSNPRFSGHVMFAACHIQDSLNNCCMGNWHQTKDPLEVSVSTTKTVSKNHWIFFYQHRYMGKPSTGSSRVAWSYIQGYKRCWDSTAWEV